MKAKFESGALRGKIQSNGTVNGGAVSKSNGTYDYDKLKNHPFINGEEIVGNKTSEDYNIVACKTSAEWAQLTTLVSMPGEIYVYSDGGEDAEGNPIPKIKIGDGNAYVVDLPFVAATDLRITQDDIDNWNNKVAVRVDGEDLIFY